jgi:hypothetical protein
MPIGAAAADIGGSRVQFAGEVLDEVIVDYPDHVPCNFMKGKPRSIISLLNSEMQLGTILYLLLH